MGQYLSIFRTQNDSLTTREILSGRYNSLFEHSDRSIPSFGKPFTTVWCRFTLKNSTGSKLFIQIQNPMFKNISLFTIHPDNSYSKQMGSDNLAFSKRDVDSNYFMFDLNVPPGSTQTFYLKMKIHSLSQFPIKAGTLKAFYATAHSRDIFNGIYFGIILALAFYNLFIFFSVKDKSYLLFVFYALFAGLSNAFINGYAFNFIWTGLPVLNNYLTVFLSLTSLFASLFAIYFLDLKKQAPVLNRIVYVFIALFLVPVTYSLLGYRFESIQIVQILDFTGAIILFTVGCIMFIRGQKHARFYMLAWSVEFIALFAFVLKNLSVLPYNFLTTNALMLGSAIEALLLSFALADRINTYKQEKELAQLLAIQSLREKEQIIINQNKILEEKVKLRTTELESINKNIEKQKVELEKSNELKDRLFSIISHDLRSPLVSLYSFLELIQIRELSQEAIEKALAKLKESLNNTNAMLDNVLYWALSQLDRLQIRVSNTSIQLVTADIFQLYKEASIQKNISLINEVPKNITIKTDSEIVKLILRNLISNAIKYTNKNGKVIVKAEKQGSAYKIYVTDDGIGMSDEKLEEIFNNDTKKSTFGTANERGTGIGLSLCCDYISKISGNIRAESQIDEGSTFVITLKDYEPEQEEIVL